MFQYEFYKRSPKNSRVSPTAPTPPEYIRLQDIAYIRSSYWAEHCLECGEPLCYETCELFVERPDARCRRFARGIYDNPSFSDVPYSAEIVFQKWGKLESIVYPGSLTPEQALDTNNLWKEKCASKRKIMALGALGKRIYPISARQAFDSDKYGYANSIGLNTIQSTPFFLLQLYSAEKNTFTLFFDITDGDSLVYRGGILIKPGYNQYVADVSKVFPGKDKLRMKIYPENNYEAHIVLLFCELVQFKEGVMSANLCPAKKIKCVAWDLDNTIWDGTFVESTPEKLSLRPGVLDTIKALDARGIVQIVVSKNTESEVLPTLDRLGISQWFVATFINWRPKSENLKAAADLININIDTFALIDDSSFEREEVKFALPMVRTYDEKVVIEINEKGDKEPASLMSLPEFDVEVTSESRNRRQMYKTEMLRNAALLETKSDPLEFLRSCNLRAHLFHPVDDASILRSYELVQRTNQLNLSGNRYEKDVFFARLKENQEQCFAMNCADKFGDYGQVLYFEAARSKENPQLLVVNEFALSCRVAHKCVEAALAKKLLEIYGLDGICALELRGKRTNRNSPLIESFCAAGFSDKSTEDVLILNLASVGDLVASNIVEVLIDK